MRTLGEVSEPMVLQWKIAEGLGTVVTEHTVATYG